MLRLGIVRLARPRAIAHGDPPLAVWQRRRLGADRFGLSHVAQPTIGTIDAPAAVHIGDQPAESFRLRLRGLDDSRDLLDGPARDAGEGTDLVPGVATVRSGPPGKFPGGRLLLHGRLDRSPDGVDLARQEVLALGVLCKLAANDLCKIDDSNWNLRSAEKLESSETAFACDQRPGLIDNDWMQKADIFDAPGKAAKVAKIAAMPLADLDRGDGDEAVGTGLSDL